MPQLTWTSVRSVIAVSTEESALTLSAASIAGVRRVSSGPTVK